MGKFSRSKGARFERDIVNLAKSYGLEARRSSLNQCQDGSKVYGDVTVCGLKVECKHMAYVPSWGKLEAAHLKRQPAPYALLHGNTTVAKWIANHDALVMHQTHSANTYVLLPNRDVLTIEQWLRQLGGKPQQ